MSNGLKIGFLVFSINLFLSIYKNVAQKVTFSATDELISINNQTKYLIERDKPISFDQIKTFPETAFNQQADKSLAFGPQHNLFWFKTNIENLDKKELYFVADYFSKVEVYYIDNEGITRKKNGGFATKLFPENLVTHPQVFKIGQKSGTLYFRAYHPNMNLKIYVSTFSGYLNKFRPFHQFVGIVIGLMIGLAFYNLFLFFSLRDSLHLIYFGYNTCSTYAIFHFNGWVYEFFGNASFLVHELNFVISIMFLFLVLFTSKYLNTKHLTPYLHKGLWLLLAIILLAGLTDFLPYRSWMMVLMHSTILIIDLYIMYLGIKIWRLGYEPAKYFVLAFGFYFIGVLITVMSLQQIFFKFTDWFPQYAYMVGMVLEALFFSFAIGFRMTAFKQQASDAQQLALKRAQENEVLFERNNQLIAEQIKAKKTDLPEFFLSLQQAKLKKLSVPTIEGTLYFPLEDIIRLEALGSYCTIYLIESKKIVASRPMSYFETMLDNSLFLRIHKSHVINLQKVAEYQKGEGGTVIMTDGSEAAVSRPMKATLLERLKLS